MRSGALTRCGIALGLALVLGAGSASAVSFGFSPVTANDVNDVNIGLAQLSVDVSLNADGTVRFLFSNAGPQASSITDVYFDDNVPLFTANSLGVGFESAGVDFAVGANPGDLPGGSTVGFTATTGFTADSEAPRQSNGVNPGESLGIDLSLLGGADLNGVLAAMGDGSLRVGIHVQGFDGDGSESFVTGPPGPAVPEPTGAAVFLIGILLIGGAVVRRGGV